MASSKRLLPWSSDDDDAANNDGGELSRPRKRWRSIVLQVSGGRRRNTGGVFGLGGIRGEEFMSMFLPFFARMVQRVVPEEIEKAILRQVSAATAPPRLLVGRNQPPRYKLMFLNDLKPVYTMMKLEDKDGSALKVAVVESLDNNQTVIVRRGYLSSAKVEVVVLHGHFNAKNEECWTAEEFDKDIVCGREKSGILLAGDVMMKLTGGEAFLENANFTDNSSFTSTKKFRLGLRFVNASGERVLEGITRPFRVKERRVEGFEKHYPPLPGDEVWRLDKIARNGVSHKALSNNGIDTVQKFLQSYVKNPEKLMAKLSKMSPTTWKAIIRHAMTCDVGDKLYSYEVKGRNLVLFFNAIHQSVGMRLDGHYKPIDQLDQAEKNLTEELKQLAYENMEELKYDHNMVNHCPVPLHRFHAKGISVSSNIPPNQLILNHDPCQYNSSLAEFSTSQGFQSREELSSFHGTTYQASVHMSKLAQGQTSNDVQFSHPLLINEVIPRNSNQGTSITGPIITHLHIPNTERPDFDSEASLPVVVHSSIQAGQVATQFGQYGQSERSCFPEESYSSFSLDHFLPTDTVMGLIQPHLQLTHNGESCSNQADLWSNSQTPIRSQQVHLTGFQALRTDSFDSNSGDQLIQSFISQLPSNGGAATPLSPRKWVKIKAALKLASVGRLSRATRRGLHRAPERTRLVPTI